ncbi:DNA ligase 3-like [Diaphorina citri]|uniref:DNA ligase 3-like n=1 Tax=Diaphorina citri TaxID=121845 RepID=A0A3Q0JDE3_DIACI|nr:DNA ligase 3-like [Diaphorina citri]
MSDKEEPNPEDDKNFWVDRAKTGRSGCKKCKQKIDTGTVRIAKMGYNPFGSGKMKQWHHIDCILEVFKKQRQTTAKIEVVDDMGGWDDLTPEDQEEVLSRFPESLRESNKDRDVPERKIPSSSEKKSKTPKKKAKSSDHDSQEDEAPSSSKKSKTESKSEAKKSKDKDRKQEDQKSSVENERDVKYAEKDNSFREFRKICAEVADIASYTSKTEVLKEFFQKGTGKGEFFSMRFIIKTSYKWNSLGKTCTVMLLQELFLFGTDQDAMLESLEQGDVAETVRIFFEQSRKVKPAKKGCLSLQQVDSFLEELSKMTREDDQVYHFEQICSQCTSNDLKMIIRLVKHDLRINSGPKHILNAIHPDAYQAFQTSRDLDSVVRKLGLGEDSKESSGDEGDEDSSSSKSNIALKLMTPVLPMLVSMAKNERCYSEIKYDGERVQVHKKGNEFKYFSRSLKPVLEHKAQPVWEISGAEFSQAEIHTADGISIRFPRVTKIRDDKDWKTATNLPELKVLFKKSKETSDFTLKPSSKRKDEPSSSKPRSTSPPPKKIKKEEKKDEGKEDVNSNTTESKTSSSKRHAASPTNRRSASPPPKKIKKEKAEEKESADENVNSVS